MCYREVEMTTATKLQNTARVEGRRIRGVDFVHLGFFEGERV